MNITKASRVSLAAVTLLAGTALLNSTRAADTDVRTMVVTYADLNLAKKEGVDALRRRLVAASHAVCGESSGGVAFSSDDAACQAAALQDALHNLRVVVAAANRGYSVASVAPN